MCIHLAGWHPIAELGLCREGLRLAPQEGSIIVQGFDTEYILLTWLEAANQALLLGSNVHSLHDAIGCGNHHFEVCDAVCVLCGRLPGDCDAGRSACSIGGDCQCFAGNIETLVLASHPLNVLWQGEFEYLQLIHTFIPAQHASMGRCSARFIAFR